jgi:uncharacterized protein
MKEEQTKSLLEKIVSGRTDLVFEYLDIGNPPDSKDSRGVSLIQWCAYYGDVSAIKFLILRGESPHAMGENFDLNGAVFHGHWKLCEYLIELGAEVNYPLKDTGETPLHAAISKTNPEFLPVVKILLQHGANPRCVTKNGIETDAFMRDCRTKGETPLHRAAAFGSEEMIQLLLDAGAQIDAKDMYGDSPLSWASWYLRPRPVLRKLCYGNFRVHP